MGDYMTFSDNLKKLRKENKLTQLALSQALNVDVMTISRYERGDMDPSITALAKIANYFNVSSDYLLGISDVRERRA